MYGDDVDARVAAIRNALRIARGLEVYQQMLDVGSSIDDFLVIGDDGATLRKFDLTEMKDKYDAACVVAIGPSACVYG